MINKAHSIQLIPTKAQKVLLHKSFGIARHSFNWALDAWKKQYKCENCGIEIDRDLNAAKNLANYSPTQKSCGSEACGDGSEPLVKELLGSRNYYLTIKF